MQDNAPYSFTLTASGGTARVGVINDLGGCGVSVHSTTRGTVTGCTSASSSNALPYLWSLAQNDKLPQGLTFDPSKGLISGTPSVGAYGTSTTLHVTATDYWGARASATLFLSVQEPLTFDTVSLPEAEVGVSYAVTLVASGGSGSYSWSIANGSLPQGLALNSSSGVISGTPKQPGANFSQLELCVGDSTTAQVCNDQPLGLRVADALTVATNSPPIASVGVLYSAGLNASGGVPGSSGFIWSIPTSSGYPLPSWLTLSSSGVVSGTAPGSAAGQHYTFAVQVADQLGASKSATVTISVSS